MSTIPPSSAPYLYTLAAQLILHNPTPPYSTPSSPSVPSLPPFPTTPKAPSCQTSAGIFRPELAGICWDRQELAGI